ncbi:CAP-D2 condensin subunit [Oratosquilla oratoria]|uniref:CAP-D2 condensin subunit n=1 Tax=Oratosquilla oratoria TaxID=337810 RepID=UPI003F775ECF
MNQFEFVIPLSLDALQECSSTRQYIVTNINSAKELPKKVQECVASFRQEGVPYILKSSNFDVLYSFILNFASLDDDTKERTWDLALKAMAKVTAELGLVLDEGDLSANTRSHWLNVLKMTTYIGCMVMETFEVEFSKPSTDTLLAGKSKKKAPKKMSGTMDWEDERGRMLLQLFSILQHPLNRLWDPPIVEEDYVNLIANCCYKMLETPTMNLQRTKPTRDSIFQIIGTLVKKFNHSLACSLKLMQLLQHFEHLTGPVAQGTVLLIQDYAANSVLSEILREISKMDHTRDTSGLRNCAQYLVEVAENCPDAIMPALSLFICFLEDDAYTMRNCVLSVLGSIVANVLSSENLDDKSKALRDQCLDLLEDHILDVHAFVRSKVLHIWNDLVSKQAVPIARQEHVLKMVVGRLKDKSSTVRKNSVQVLTAFLKSNPFAAKLPLEELEAQHKAELKKLHEMAPETALEEAEPPPIEKIVSPAELWAAMIPEVVEAIEAVETEDGDEEEEEETELPSDCCLNDAISLVADVLVDNKLKRAVRILKEALETFRRAEIFKYDPQDRNSKKIKSICDKEIKDEHLRYIVIFQRVFLSYKEMERMNDVEEKKDEKEKDKDEEGKEDNEEEKKEEEKENEEVTKQKMLVSYLKGSVGFAEIVHKALPLVCQLLGSKQISDIMEAIHFFVTAFEFGMLNAMTGVRKMLVLVWSKESTVKDAVVNAYRRLYINIEASNERIHAQQVVKNLTALVTGATLGELSSLEEVVAQFVNEGDINKHCITVLWEKFTQTIPNTTDEEAKSALVLLAMASNSEVSIMSSNISVLVKCGLGERGENDFERVKETCLALLKLAVTNPKTESAQAPQRYQQDHEIFTRLSHILVDGVSKQSDRMYSPMAIQAVNTIYALAEHPDVICGEIVKALCKTMRIMQEENAVDNPEDDPLTVPAFILSRFLTIVGHIALKQYIHLDTYIFSELKRRSYLKEELEAEKKKKKLKKSKRKSTFTSASEASVLRSSQEGEEEEMGLTGAVADDMEAEYIRSICEEEIVYNDNLLSIFSSLIIAVCSNPSKYKDPELQTAAALALSKYMMVSSHCCEENLQLLFTILEKATEPVIRANIIIALGDLSFRFPNLIEPWTPMIYARLRDDVPSVRRNTLTVLTHLILNDMIKVKGQISDIAMCITDEDPRIAGLSKLFFSELARKGNALYNVLPDIISRLSSPEIGVGEERFRTILSHILNLVQKDKQMENLIEKLCHRFQATTTPRQWRDITYSLSLLQFSDRSVNKLSESFACYSDKLYEHDVYDLFLGILASARKTVKQEMKTIIDELEDKIQKAHEKGLEDETTANKAARAKHYKKSARRSVTKGPKKNIRKVMSESEDEEEENLHPAHRDNKENKERLPRRESLPRNKSKKKYTMENGSDDSDGGEKNSSDEEDFVPNQEDDVRQNRVLKPAPQTRRASKRKL